MLARAAPEPHAGRPAGRRQRQQSQAGDSTAPPHSSHARIDRPCCLRPKATARAASSATNSTGPRGRRPLPDAAGTATSPLPGAFFSVISAHPQIMGSIG